MVDITELEGSITKYTGEGFFALFKTSCEYMPYINQIISNRKSNRLERRVQENSSRLKTLTNLAGTCKLSEEFIQDKIGPIVFLDFIEEHEDAKIHYILTGFQNVFLEEKSKESIIYNYFDTLRGLRYADLRRLLYHAELDQMYPSSEELEETEVVTFTKSVDIKLRNLHLIEIPATFGSLNGKTPDIFDKERKYNLSSYGNQFIKFIT